MPTPRQGPLTHLTVIEFAGLGPAPFAAMMLADQGARVIRIDRPEKQVPRGAVDAAAGLARLTARRADVLARGRESIALDLKRPAARELVLRLVERCDALIEGYRPGVMEGLGLGPDVCLARRPALVYTRVTGWGQTGPLAQRAGHDINYTALTGALHSSGGRPTAGLIGDFGGGGMLAAFGLLAAVAQAGQSGRGQVVDAAVLEGSALLTGLLHGWRSAGLWQAEHGRNMGDGGAPFFNTYACADGRLISVGAIEPPFYAQLLQHCGLADDPAFTPQWDQARWPDQQARLAAVFARRPRAAWCALFDGSDACVAPVLDLDEAALHPHTQARATFVQVDGVNQPAPAPRYSATPPGPCAGVGPVGAQTRTVLAELGCPASEIETLLADGTAWAPAA